MYDALNDWLQVYSIMSGVADEMFSEGENWANNQRNRVLSTPLDVAAYAANGGSAAKTLYSDYTVRYTGPYTYDNSHSIFISKDRYWLGLV